MSNNTLRALAQRAKNRLKAISCENTKSNSISIDNNSKVYEEACLSARVQYAIIASQKKIEDDPLYNKVKKMLVKNVDIQNPLAQLIEQDVYSNLSSTEQEKYMYKLSKRYITIREHVLNELKENNVSSL